MNDLMQVLEAAVKKTFAEWLRPVAHAECVVQVQPVWATARTLRAIVGLNRDQLNRLVTKRLVAAKAADGTVLYRVADVLGAIDSFPSK